MNSLFILCARTSAVVALAGASLAQTTYTVGVGGTHATIAEAMAMVSSTVVDTIEVIDSDVYLEQVNFGGVDVILKCTAASMATIDSPSSGSAGRGHLRRCAELTRRPTGDSDCGQRL